MTKEQEILETLIEAWMEQDMPVPGGVSYNTVFAYLKSLGADTKPAESQLAQNVKRFEQILKHE